VKPTALVARDAAPRNLWVVDLAPGTESVLQEVLDGLSQPRKTLPPKLFYDRRGAELFTAICTTQAYYPTRTENGILDRGAEEQFHALVKSDPGIFFMRKRARQDKEDFIDQRERRLGDGDVRNGRRIERAGKNREFGGSAARTSIELHAAIE